MAMIHRRKTGHWARRRRSVTIIEIVMAIVILAISMPTLMTAFVEASMQTIQPSLASVASFLATDRMEEIIARRYRATDGYDAVTAANFPAENPVSGFTRYARTVTVTFVNSSLATVGSDQGYKKVRVTVSWNSGAESIAIERIFANF